VNAPETPTVVVVDDDEAIRYALQKKLTRFGLKIISLDKAEDALFLLKNPESAVDLVVTDIKLRKMDGIELLRHINILERPVPVLIITGQGNIEDAIRALRYGARDFIRKPIDINEVASIVRRILRSEQEKQLASAFGKYIRSERRSYVIPVDPTVIDVMSYELTRNLMPFGLCNYTASENVALALQEAISNAMFHGNLEIDSAVRAERGIKGFNEEIEARRTDERYRDRTVRIQYDLNPEYVEYVIEDDGPGFNYNALPDPRDQQNFFKDSGRGILIIRIHMDEISWSERGNAIRMRKYRIDAKSAQH